MDDAPGWAAIDDALRRIYGDTEPRHWGTLIRWSLGGPDPLDGVSAYERADPLPHWHFVTYGMSELYAKESGVPDESGWGFEFTFRLAREHGETEPPIWPANFLQNLARYVFSSGNWFEAGHSIDANGPIAADKPDSTIRAAAFVQDPELGAIDTPHGSVRFLQVVGLATDEYRAAQQWNALSLLEALEPRMPLYVTDIGRPSFMPEVAETVRAGIRQDGSSLGELYVDDLGWQVSGAATTLKLASLRVSEIGQALSGRLPYGRGLLLTGPETSIGFLPGDTFAVDQRDGMLEVTLPPAALDELLRALAAGPGRTPFSAAPGLVLEF